MIKQSVCRNSKQYVLLSEIHLRRSRIFAINTIKLSKIIKQTISAETVSNVCYCQKYIYAKSRIFLQLTP